jgi:hypothetical protein
MSIHSIIEHRANYYFLKIEEDYLHICKGDHCKAAILAILEHWTNEKKSKGKGLFIYMTYPQWITSMYGLYGRSYIMERLAQLEAEGLIEKRPYRLEGRLDTFEYALNIQAIQNKLRELPEKGSHDTRPNLNPFKIKRVQKQTGIEVDASPVQNKTDNPSKSGRNIESITQNTDYIDYHNEDSCVSANASTPALADLSEDVSLQETVKVPAIPKALSLKSVRSENDSHFQISTAGVDKSQTPGDKSPVKRKPTKPKEEPTPDEIELAARCSAWYKRLTEWCGGPLSKGGAVMNEHRCIKLLCQRYSDAQIDAIFAYLTTKDWKWSKVDNKFNVRGYLLESEAGRVARILEESGKPNKPVSNSTSAYAERPTALVSVEQARINRERRDARIAALTAAGGR